MDSLNDQIEQRDPLLGHDGADVTHSEEINANNGQLATTRVPSNIARRLYISHFLSTWNTRVFEFGAVLYLATIFPNTLLPMSVYAVARGVAAIVLSPGLGRYIDKAERLRCVRLSIGMIGWGIIHFLISKLMCFDSSSAKARCGCVVCTLFHPESEVFIEVAARVQSAPIFDHPCVHREACFHNESRICGERLGKYSI